MVSKNDDELFNHESEQKTVLPNADTSTMLSREQEDEECDATKLIVATQLVSKKIFRILRLHRLTQSFS